MVYVSTETPMMIYLNVHAVIDHLRQKAESNDDCGPRVPPYGTSFRLIHVLSHAQVMVCGPGDVGKSTLCRILLNYAVRKNRKPCLVDVDVGQVSSSLNSVTV